ncbi:MAG: hypothetical protein JWL70_98 [Acidimicrobiia bacterium]|nr:hypothetical protein [Acidimicrobiia bacterium]
MPVPLPEDLGPLAALAGVWEGDDGVDVAYSNSLGVVAETPFRERATFSPFGPVENGAQALFGLDYRTAAYRRGETEPFHTEVGYWLWDSAAGQVMRCFMVPRGSTILAGGAAHADATSFVMQAEVGSETYGILSNQYLAVNARTTLYQVSVDLAGGVYRYESTTTVALAKLDEPLAHTDRNALHRVE